MGKMNKSDFIKYVAETNNMPVPLVSQVYDSLINGIFDIVSGGDNLSLAGFGLFYLQKHKKHPVRFSSENKDIDDYLVLKFSASDAMNNRIRSVDDNEMPNIDKEKILMKQEFDEEKILVKQD